jgi:GMP reductase
MDTTGTFSMAMALAKYKCLTTIHKYYQYEDWISFAEHSPSTLPYTSISAGVSAADFDLLKSVL